MKNDGIDIKRLGGRLCLDFLNTANWDSNNNLVEEKLTSDKALHQWCQSFEIEFSEIQKREIELEDILRFRNSIRAIFLSVLRKYPVDLIDLTFLNNVVKSIHGSDDLLTYQGSRLRFAKSVTIKQMVAFSAISLLNEDTEIQRLKICPGNNCGWLFLDGTKNARRQWCSMKICGNRAKAKRHYETKRK